MHPPNRFIDEFTDRWHHFTLYTWVLCQIYYRNIHNEHINQTVSETVTYIIFSLLIQNILNVFSYLFSSIAILNTTLRLISMLRLNQPLLLQIQDGKCIVSATSFGWQTKEHQGCLEIFHISDSWTREAKGYKWVHMPVMPQASTNTPS